LSEPGSEDERIEVGDDGPRTIWPQNRNYTRHRGAEAVLDVVEREIYHSSPDGSQEASRPEESLIIRMRAESQGPIEPQSNELWKDSQDGNDAGARAEDEFPDPEETIVVIQDYLVSDNADQTRLEQHLQFFITDPWIPSRRPEVGYRPTDIPFEREHSSSPETVPETDVVEDPDVNVDPYSTPPPRGPSKSPSPRLWLQHVIDAALAAAEQDLSGALADVELTPAMTADQTSPDQLQVLSPETAILRRRWPGWRLVRTPRRQIVYEAPDGDGPSSSRQITYDSTRSLIVQVPIQEEEDGRRWERH